QNKKIELLQEEFLRFKKDFLQKKPLSFSSSSPTEEVTDKISSIKTPSTARREKEEPFEPEKPLLEAKKSEKEELKQALKIIDNL
ncbi:MAG: hypothetical protein ACXACU_06455, partial [Candidatus Hodarchaeales archaeon]